MKIEVVPVGSLSLDPANARTHDEKNLKAIMASLRRFGQQKPIVVDISGVVRAGNGTLQAAEALGWDTISVVRSQLKGADMIAYGIADNRTTDLSSFDSEIIRAQLEAMDSELQMCAGYDEADIAAILSDYDEDVPSDDCEDDYKDSFQVVVECEDERDMQSTFDDLKAKGLDVKIRVS